MKKAFIFITILSLYTTSLLATPSWYGNIKEPKPNIYIGYGSSDSENEAKQNALLDISSQISTKIDSNLETTKRKSGNEYNKDIVIKSSQKTNSNISEYDLLKVDYDHGKYYVAIEYENISNIDRFIKKLKDINLSNESQNSFISKTHIAKELKKRVVVDIDFRLVRLDGKWFLKYKDINQLILKKDFEKFFVSIQNAVKFETNKNPIYDGDEFYFKVNSKKSGFLSILTIYEDGTVSTLYRNIQIEKDKNINVPDKEFENILEAGILEKGVDTFDMYVFILSDKKLYLDRFVRADSEAIEDERAKNFDELIEFLDGKEYSTLKVATKAR